MTDTTRLEWLIARRGFITATDAALIMSGPWQFGAHTVTDASIVDEKRGATSVVHSARARARMHEGHRIEAEVADWFALRHANSTARLQRASATWPERCVVGDLVALDVGGNSDDVAVRRAAATPDWVQINSAAALPRLIECKWTHRSDYIHSIVSRAELQLRWQMLVCRCNTGYVYVFTPTRDAPNFDAVIASLRCGRYEPQVFTFWRVPAWDVAALAAVRHWIRYNLAEWEQSPSEASGPTDATEGPSLCPFRV